MAQRPRYFGHAAVAIVGVAAAAVVALQPQPLTISSSTAAPAVQPTIVALAPEAPPAAQPTEVVVEPTAVPAPETNAPPKPFPHVVAEGESIRSLADSFGLHPFTILGANDISDPDMIRVGQELLILPVDGVLHTIQEGETLRTVAERFGVPTSTIVAANDLGPDPDLVAAGTDIVIPGVMPNVQVTTSQFTAGGGQQAATIGAPYTVGPPADAVVRRITPSARTYTVQEGDTLRSIAEVFGVDVPTILSSNGIDDPDTIRPGSQLRILPVKGIEYEVQEGETLADIAFNNRLDLGILLDYNDLSNPDVINVGARLILPGVQFAPAPVVAAPVPQAGVGPGPSVAVPAAPAPAPAPKPAPVPQPAPENVVGPGGANIVANAMKYAGYPYVFGGTSPRGFDCSGFVFYIHSVTGNGVGRGMWQQYNGGPQISMGDLVPGDTVFFANTYMPGLSHNGIYIGNGQFIHASDPGTGVVVSSMHSSYWSSRYVGATRLWGG